MDFGDNWNKFLSIIKCNPTLSFELNKGCSEVNINRMEKRMAVSFPPDLRTLYVMNNGQRGNRFSLFAKKNAGIFKALSGHSKHSNPVFLNLHEVFAVWKRLNKKQLDVFKSTYIPFAASRVLGFLDDVYCVDSQTGEVYLLWVFAHDWTLPQDWQTAKFQRGLNLSQFITSQIELN